MLGQVKSGEKCKTCSLGGIAERWPRFIGGSAWATDGGFAHAAFTGVKHLAERLGSQASNQNVAGSIPGRPRLRCVLGQGTSPYLLWGDVPVLTVSRSG